MSGRVPQSLLFYILPSLCALALLLQRYAGLDVRRVRMVWFCSLLSALLALGGHYGLGSLGAPSWLGEVARTLAEIAAIQVFVPIFFQVMLRRLRLPRFLGDILVVMGYAAVLLSLLSRLGANVTGLIATSAVATAVIGLSLQDMLGNLAGGLVLELERAIQAGDWIEAEGVKGSVNHVSLRHTSVQSPDGDTILIPNSLLTRTPVTRIAANHRTTVSFILSYRRNPSRVIEAVEHALSASPIDGVATHPKPKCLLLGFQRDHIEYGVQIWLTKPGHEQAASSATLTRIYFALARIGSPMRPIPQVLDVHTEQNLADTRPEAPDLIAALQQIPLFRTLNDEEISRLAPRLKHLSFAPGEMILRQGDDGESMFLILQGRAGVLLTNSAGLTEQVATLQAGDFFGEMSLLTGEKRSATVTGQSLVECLRLDKADLYDMLSSRAEIAEDMSLVIAERQVELAALRDKLDQESSLLRIQETRTHLLERICNFFGIESLRGRISSVSKS